MQVFASDLDDGALIAAREGRYPIAIEADMTEERLRRFFSREGDHYRVTSELRDMVLIAKHSLLKDPPFSRVDLVSCRNVLIYLDREVQQQVAPPSTLPCSGQVTYSWDHPKTRTAPSERSAPLNAKRESISACPFHRRCGLRLGPAP